MSTIKVNMSDVQINFMNKLFLGVTNLDLVIENRKNGVNFEATIY